MLTVSVTTAKNEFSQLLRRVKRGERIVITERNRPIAQLQPFSATEACYSSSDLTSLYNAGVLTAPAIPGLDVAAFFALPTATLMTGRTLSAAILAERD